MTCYSFAGSGPTATCRLKASPFSCWPVCSWPNPHHQPPLPSMSLFVGPDKALSSSLSGTSTPTCH